MPFTLQQQPFTECEPITETIHGVEITDPYRWLENQSAPTTRRWIDAQTAHTRAYFAELPRRGTIRRRVSELVSNAACSDPWRLGNSCFFTRREDAEQQPSIIMRNEISGEETILVSPSRRRGGNVTALNIETISPNGRFLAYSVREGGTDYASTEIVDTRERTILPDRIQAGFCSGLIFSPDDSGFYYSNQTVTTARPHYRALRWHQLGTELADDPEIFVAGEQPGLNLATVASWDAGVLVHAVVCAGKHRKTALYIQPITGRGEAAVLARDIEGYCIPFFVRGELIALTDFAAPNFRIIRIDTNNPATCNWKDIVPESNFRIQRFAVAGDRIFVTRVHRFSTHIEVFGTDGVRWEDPIPPFLGSVELLRRTNESQHLFFSSTSICQVPTTHCLDTSTNKMVDWFVAGIPFDPSNIIVEEVTYQSKDGMQVPMLLAVRKDLHGSGPLPTFITGYGGFGACVTPRFTAFSTFLLEQGLLIAVPGVRGGSELGEEWHRAGMRENRQTSFDDFIASVEWLVAQGRAAPGRICIGGGSNAGLLVGAVVTQRPELFSAVVCLGPLLDMLRYQLFDHARGWSDEYGCADDEEDFRFLMAYSPYHHIQPNVPYPAVLFISGDADNRCNPMHARKMTARMQGATSSERPILLDYRANWGHTPVQPLSVKVDALTDRLAFVCDQLGINVACERT